MKTSTPSVRPSLDLPTRLYRGERPFRSLLALYRHDLDKLGLSLLFYVIKHSPEWIKPIVVANVIDIISNPGTRSLSSCLILSAKGARTEDLKYYQSSTYNLSTAMTSIQSPTTLTLAEFLQLPETKPASEYIDGRIYQKPMPKGKQSAIQTFLAPAINQISIRKKLARAFTELRCTFEGRSLVPDITVFAWQRIPLDADGEIENTFEIAPDWTIEILSPDQSPTRVINNILFCLNHGTELGWLIDPQERMIMTLKPGQQPEIKQEEENLPVLSLLGDWQLSVQEVFSYLSLN